MNTLYIILAILTLLFISGYFRSKRAKKMTIRIIDNNCTGCHRCLKRCGHKVFEVIKDGDREHITVKYPEKCTACANCIAVCKFNALELVDRKQPEEAVSTVSNRL